MPRPHSAPRGRVRQLKPWNANAVHTERHAWDPPANSLCQQRHLQDHLRRHPAPSGCLPRGRLRRFPLHQHLSNDPRYVLPTPPPQPRTAAKRPRKKGNLLLARPEASVPPLFRPKTSHNSVHSSFREANRPKPHRLHPRHHPRPVRHLQVLDAGEPRPDETAPACP